MKTKTIKSKIREISALQHDIMLSQKMLDIKQLELEYYTLDGTISYKELGKLKAEVYAEHGKELYFK
jgi:hypothetical protein